MHPAERSCRLALLSVVVGLALMLTAPAAHPTQVIIDADSQYSYAQSRLAADAFDEAIAEFNRFIHFFPADSRVPQARYRIGTAHYRAGRYPEAAAVFEKVIDTYTGTPIQNEAYFMLSRSHAAQGMIEQASVDLHNLLMVVADTDVADRARYELGWLHVSQEQWGRAERSFDQITSTNQERLQIPSLREALSENHQIPMKSPATAGALSIVPGGGQLYVGRYRDALTAFVVNAGMIWAAWEAFENDLVALGGVITFVEFGFYAGNIYGAAGSARKYNREQIDTFRNNLNRHRQTTLSLAPVPNGAALCLKLHF